MCTTPKAPPKPTPPPLKPDAMVAGEGARKRANQAQAGFQTILNIGGAGGLAPGATTAQPKTQTGQ
jgi:hypothetical protein